MEVKSIAVIGAGQMGRGIAHVGALGGYQVALLDVSEDLLARSVGVIRANLEKGVQLGKVQRGDADATLGRLRTTTNLADAAGSADLVIEAVPEKMDLKQRVFGQLDEVCRPEAVLASNTSALSITEIGSATRRQDKVIGMHFFIPAHIMRLVEIVRGLETSEDTIATIEEVARRMGKETVCVKDYPGYVTSRMNNAIRNEAFKMLMEGVASAEDIDKAIKLGLNHPMGPFEMADMVGMDTALSVMQHLSETLGERFRPTPLMANYVRAGRFGRKVGKGVYEYPAKG